MRRCGRAGSTRTSPICRCDLAGTQAAASGQAEEDEIQLRVARAWRFAFEIREDCGQFTAHQTFVGLIDRCVCIIATFLRGVVENDLALAAVVGDWAKLPDAIKAAILALVDGA
jgi:hypothetical protein